MSIETLTADTPMEPAAAQQYSPLTLAFLGDSVYEVMVRDQILREANRPARDLHTLAVAHVRAAYQADAALRIADMLSDEEAEIFRRGRNASGISVPKHATPADYRKATGIECLFGYLFLCGRAVRLRELFRIVWEDSAAETAEAEAE